VTGKGSDPPASEDGEIAARIARLSAGELQCLRLVDEHRSSKEIAAMLGISPHTVDQRIRQALETLGVERRSQAARLVAQHRRANFEQAIEEKSGQPAASFGISEILPFATSGNPQNQMSAAQRLLWIVMIAVGAAFTAGIVMAGIESVTRLMRRGIFP